MVKESVDALEFVKGLEKPKRNMVLINQMEPVKELTNLNKYLG